jgi:choline dehydrogenase
LGNPGWGFDETMSCFHGLETDLDFVGPWHGDRGPVRVRRYQEPELTPIQKAFLEACVVAGLRRVADHNQPGALGPGPLPVNAVGGVRQSAALSYLGPARGRPKPHHPGRGAHRHRVRRRRDGDGCPARLQRDPRRGRVYRPGGGPGYPPCVVGPAKLRLPEPPTRRRTAILTSERSWISCQFAPSKDRRNK